MLYRHAFFTGAAVITGSRQTLSYFVLLYSLVSFAARHGNTGGTIASDLGAPFEF